MKYFYKITLLLILLNSSLNACELCSLNVPNIHLNTTIKAKNDSTQFHIQWKFEESFVKSLMQYDENENGKFDKPEQDNIQESLDVYLNKLNYLIDIAYVKKDVKVKKHMYKKIQNTKTSMNFKNNTMYYNIEFSLDFIMKKDYKIYLNFFDEQDNFNFMINNIIFENFIQEKTITMNSQSATIHLYKYIKKEYKSKKTEAKKVTHKNIESLDENKSNENNSLLIVKKPEKDIQNEETLLETLSSTLSKYKMKIETLLKDIKDNDSIDSYFWLLLFSFVYGVLHAIGPGHGKSLVAAYFLSEDKSYIKGFNISVLIGVVHTFSALILTLSIYFILNMLFSNIVNDIEEVATKVSAVVIIFIALYLLYKKLKQAKEHKGHSHNDNSCSCSSHSTKSTDLGVILAAGIVPCPGTVTIFLFTIGLGIYFVGFLSAVFMSMGMSLVIFITAYLSTKVRKKSTSNKLLIKTFEYGSLVFILFLGLILLVI